MIGLFGGRVAAGELAARRVAWHNVRMAPVDDERGRALFDAIEAAMAPGAPLPIEELARRVGCTPREALEVLLRFDSASRITVVPTGDDSDFVVRPSSPPG